MEKLVLTNSITLITDLDVMEALGHVPVRWKTKSP